MPPAAAPAIDAYGDRLRPTPGVRDRAAGAWARVSAAVAARVRAIRGR